MTSRTEASPLAGVALGAVSRDDPNRWLVRRHGGWLGDPDSRRHAERLSAEGLPEHLATLVDATDERAVVEMTMRYVLGGRLRWQDLTTTTA